MNQHRPTVSAVVIAYGDEPLLVPCVEAILASTDVRPEVVLVDNGATTDAVELLADRPGVRVLRPGTNTGFAGGCNLGAAAGTGDMVALVNGDAIVEPGALAELARALTDPTVGVASASLRLLDRPDVINSSGNPVHFLGLSWAGGLGESAAEHAVPGDVASATGAAMAVRRGDWEALGGFPEAFFMYLEDTELSLRCWQSGLRVVHVPSAVVRHRYEFSRNPQKFYLLERNRLFLVLTLYSARTLLVLAPMFVALELAMLAVAVRGGWARQKVRGWWWLLTHRRLVRERRRWVQERRLVPDRELGRVLTGRFEPGEESGMPRTKGLSSASEAVWRVVRRWIG